MESSFIFDGTELTIKRYLKTSELETGGTLTAIKFVIADILDFSLVSPIFRRNRT